MSLVNLPDDLIQRIFCSLLDSPQSYLNLAYTCKRLNDIACNRVVHSSEWAEARPLTFNLNLDLDKYWPELCDRHKFCDELQWKNNINCEVQQWLEKKRQKIKRQLCAEQYALKYNRLDRQAGKHQSAKLAQGVSVDSKTVDSIYSEVTLPSSMKQHIMESCFYHRLFCMLNTRYITFSSLRFDQVRLKDRGCIRAIRDCLILNRQLTELKINALVDLQLYRCDITLDWLNTILSSLNNVKYLALDEVSFIDPTLLVEPKDFASKVLKRLSITGDRSYHLNDLVFTYFLDNFPAVEFDLSGTRLEYHKRIIQRYYNNNASSLDLGSWRPSEYILTFPIILMYLRKYSSIVRHFVVDRSDITFTSLKKILQEETLKDLTVSVKNCPMIPQFERSRFYQLEGFDFSRVLF